MGEFRELVAVVFLSRTWLYYSTCLRSEYLQREGNMPVSAKTVQSVRSVGHQNRGRASSSRRVAAVASENTLGGVVFSPFDEVEGSLKLVQYIQTCIPTYLHNHIPTCLRTYHIPTCLHAYIPTY